VVDPLSAPIERTLPFGVGATSGCCPTSTDPAGTCKGACGPDVCVNAQTPDVASQCPGPGAKCGVKCEPGAMSLTLCAELCNDLGYAISGVEYANQCNCGHQLAAFALAEGGQDTSEAECKSGCAGCPGEGPFKGRPQCDACKCPGDKSQWCGGGCAMSVREVVCSWGSPFLILFALGLCGYVGGGVAWARKTKGLPMALGSHPHHDGLWVEVRGLCMDGVEFAQSQSGVRIVSVGQGRPRKGGGDGGGSYGAVDAGGGSPGGKRRKEKKEKKKERKEGKGDREGKHEGKNSRAEETVGAAAPEAGARGVSTASGGGGRWVHVPT